MEKEDVELVGKNHIVIKGTEEAIKLIKNNARLCGMTVSGYLVMLARQDAKERHL